MAGEPFFPVEFLVGPEALNLYLSIKYAQNEYGANLVSISSDGCPAIDAIDKTVSGYLNLRRNPAVSKNAASATLLSPFAFLMLDLARPKRIFRKKCADIAAAVTVRELRRHGWQSELDEAEWGQVARGLFLGTGANEDFIFALEQHWVFTDIPDPSVYDPIHSWAQRYPWYQALRAKLKVP